ncbi:MAG: acylphosphatase [Pirellulales bacterium]
MAERWEVLFSGRVQGVGFRQTTCTIAERYEVTGAVRNLVDGRVEMVAEGDASELARFLDAIEGAMSGFIRDSKRHRYPATGEFDGFRIVRG